jgi:hypothetical protein
MFRKVKLADISLASAHGGFQCSIRPFRNKAPEMSTTWGYAGFDGDQELGLQIAALHAAGVPKPNIVQKKASRRARLDREAAQ